MKTISIVMAMVLAGLTTNAASIRGGRLDETRQNLLLDVTYSGGCGQHDFSLDLHGCLESMPVQCSASLVHKTNDFCEAMISKTITINLAEQGIKGSYFSEASLTVSSEVDQILGNDVKVTVYLPELFDVMDNPSANDEADVTCTTHTGSLLTISPEQSSVKIVTVQGEELNYSVVDKGILFLETFPVQVQTKYSLDDGRKIVTTFMDGSMNGRGFYIRIGGETSPSFDCKKN